GPHQPGGGGDEEQPLPEGGEVLELAMPIGVVPVGGLGAPPQHQEVGPRDEEVDRRVERGRAEGERAGHPGARPLEGDQERRHGDRRGRAGVQGQPGGWASRPRALTKLFSCSTPHSGVVWRAIRRRRMSRASAALSGWYSNRASARKTWLSKLSGPSATARR